MLSKKQVILNSKGEPITLNAMEKHNVNWMAKQLQNQYGGFQTPFLNALGYEAAITTLTTISKKITTQCFYEIPFAEYFPVRVGEGTWSSNLTTFRSFDAADEFETGIINTGGQNARLASVDAAIDALNIKVFPWGKSLGYTIFDLEFAAKSGNWDLVAAKEKARKRNWDLGLQRIAFLGARGMNGANGACLGLLNQSGITFNNTLLTQAISALSTTSLAAFPGAAIEAFRSNSARTKYPNRLIIPESDYNSLANQASPTFPIKSIIEVLEGTFKTITRNQDFKIMPLAYGDKAYSALSTQMYVLLCHDEESIRMDIPLDYTTTLANSLDNFSFQNAGYGQFTGVLAYRPLEMLYFGF